MIDTALWCNEDLLQIAPLKTPKFEKTTLEKKQYNSRIIKTGVEIVSERKAKLFRFSLKAYEWLVPIKPSRSRRKGEDKVAVQEDACLSRWCVGDAEKWASDAN